MDARRFAHTSLLGPMLAAVMVLPAPAAAQISPAEPSAQGPTAAIVVPPDGEFFAFPMVNFVWRFGRA